MTQRIYWGIPANPSVSRFRVFSASSAALIAQNPQGLQSSLAQLASIPGALAMLAVVPADVTGANFDRASGRYFYDDPSGQPPTIYDVQGFGGDDTVIADSGIFQAQQVQGATLATRVMVDHDYQGIDNLRYVTPGGVPIPDALIQAFKTPDFLAGRYDLAYARSQTDTDGRWAWPMYLEPGLQWTLLLSVYGSFGPTRIDITV